MRWLSVLSTLFIKCVHFIFTYTIQSTLPSLLGHIVGRIILTWFSTLQNTYKCIDYSYHQPSNFDLTFWHVSQNTSIHLLTFVESSIGHLTQLKTFHSKVVHNCYWYADYMHCPWINGALVTGHETWLAYENYIWITVTRSLHTYPILIN